MITNQQSNNIDILKGLLPILVIAFHTSFDPGLSPENGFESFLRVLICKMGEVAVPAFFFISGLLFFSNLEEWDWNIYRGNVRKRVGSLFLPYVIWIIITSIAKFSCSVLKKGFSAFDFSALREYFNSQGHVCL